MTDTHGPTPLPCSLDPLEDETLPGFLLRLSHRLERSPARMMQLTGLAADRRFASRVSHEKMLHLTPAELRVFSSVTRLSSEEADQLCFTSMNELYPTGFHPGIPPKGLLTRGDFWVLSTASRYCPECLTGDGSVVQADHGGAWKRTWRLPVTFACTRHHRLLEHLCPQCLRPACDAGPTTGRFPMIAAASAIGLHPAQCWLPLSGSPELCGQRLDVIRPPGLNLPGPVLALQKRLAGFLDPLGPRHTVSAGSECTTLQYFNDLRLLAHLVATTWPQARALAPSEELAVALDDRSPTMRPNTTTRPTTNRRQPDYFTTFRADVVRPADPAVSACLLTIADAVLTQYDTDERRSLLRQLLPGDKASVNGRWGWGSTFSRKYAQSCSPGLRELVTPLTTPYTFVGARTPPSPITRSECGPQHVPQVLPAHWVEELLGELSLSPGDRNHLAVCRLVQMMRGGSLGDAAYFLGLPTYTPQGHRISARGGLVLRAAEEKGLDWLDKTLLKIPDRLQEAGLIDYRHRRETLQNWLIPKPVWTTMTSKILSHQHGLSPAKRELFTSEAERILDSVAVWTFVTHGRKTLAPQMKKYRSAVKQRRQHPTWKAFIHDGRGHHAGQQLLDLLQAYAEDLAHQIDHRLLA
ncbi:TniQ family protein [Streptomyces sp. GZWMJZ-114]|uniref:TniQ family protein n=1 Tax=Streptomyces sp. GZWMJZ-114 TaxID=2494734 RepID=UPI0013E92A09|nr:TniQ family protein [Streptomyces sp. GZWMJZ-114]